MANQDDSRGGSPDGGAPPRPDQGGPAAEGEPGREAHEAHHVIDPQRLLRVASVTREVLEEIRRMKPEQSAVAHLRELHGRISEELRQSLPSELYEELDDLTPEIRSDSLEELALAHAEILGWMEGLFQGTQLALQMQAARALMGRGGPPGGQGPPGLPPGAVPRGTDGPREQDPRYL